MRKIITSIIMLSITTSLSADNNKKMPWYKQIFSNEKVTLSTMNYAQLTEAKNKAIARNDHFSAIRYLERMAKVCPDLAQLSSVILELADLLFVDNKYAKAQLLYDQYIKSFPGKSHDYSFAFYRKILCSFYQTVDFDRDQTATEQTVELCETFLKNCKESNYEKDVRSIKTDCTQKLAKHELYIADNYVIQNKYMSANRRITQIRDRYQTVPEVEPELLLVEIKLAEKVGNTQYAQAKQHEFTEKFPEHKSIAIAQTKKQKSMAHRF